MAKATHKAVSHKPYTGSACYVTAAAANFFFNKSDDFDLVIEQPDGSKIELQNERTIFLVVMNGRYGGGHVACAPVALLNDGLCDIVLQHGPDSKKEIIHFIRHAMVGRGSHIYRDNYAYFRGSSVRIINKNFVP